MKKRIDPKAIALRFNDCINNRDLDSLVNLMTDDHKFIDNENRCVEGKINNKINWKKFFELFLDYQNVFEFVSSRDSTIIIQGYSVCSDKRLDLNSIWTARILGDKVEEWRVYIDNEGTRKKLGI